MIVKVIDRKIVFDVMRFTRRNALYSGLFEVTNLVQLPLAWRNIEFTTDIIYLKYTARA